MTGTKEPTPESKLLGLLCWLCPDPGKILTDSTKVENE
jgi:hypothetical protein